MHGETLKFDIKVIRSYS